MPVSKELLDRLLEEANTKDLFGQDGLIKELTGRLVERMLEAEMTEHLGYSRHAKSAREAALKGNAAKTSKNARNGHTAKTLRGEQGTLTVRVPRDRDASFEPQVVPKHMRRLPGFDEKVIALYAGGMSVREIQQHLEDLYQVEVSRELISRVTDEVLSDVRAWRSRPLEAVYPILWLDAIFVKVRHEGRIAKRAVYVALAVGMEGRKEVLGLWMAETERASFWLGVLTELKSRGLDDVFVCCVDGLAGFESAIEAVYPQTTVQQCIVHLVRSSTRYVPWKDRKRVCADLRAIYQAPTAEAAAEAFSTAKANWPQYPGVAQPWEAAWARVVPLFGFVPDLRRVLYTTNAVESLNRQMRRSVKTRGSFPSDEAVYKVLYLAIERATRSWKKAIWNWKAALRTFEILYPERMPKS